MTADRTGSHVERAPVEASASQISLSEIKDLPALESCAEDPTIPAIFHRDDLGLVMIKRHSKEPSEMDWQVNPAYRHNDIALLDHIQQGGNIAIRCGDNGMIVLDIDELERIRALGVIDRLPLTTTWETRPGREQRLFICKDWKPETLAPYVPNPETRQVKLFDPEMRDSKNPNAYLHLGEIQGARHYALIPPSVKLIDGVEVPYRMVDARPPVEVSLSEVLKTLRDASVRFSALADIRERSHKGGQGGAMAKTSGTEQKAREFLGRALSKATIGTRNDTAFWLACQLRDLGVPLDDASEIMTEYALDVPKGDGWSKEEALRTLKSAFDEGAREPPKSQASCEEEKPKSGGGRESIATKLVNLALSSGIDLWHSQEETPFATLEISGHKEHHPLDSDIIRQWLSRLLYNHEGRSPGSQAVQDAINVLAGRACFDGPRYDVHVRVAEHDSVIYIDLGDKSWRCIKVTSEGWEIAHDVPVRFRRSNTMLPLPEPIRGGNWADFRALLNAPDDFTWILAVGWLIQVYWPRGPYSHLALVGEQGCGKTTFARMLKMSVDPSITVLRRPPKDEKDLMIAGNNERMVSFDNLSGLPANLSDALCNMSTGGALAGRALYTDMNEVFMTVQRPVILNGIDAIGSRGDLLDRTIVLELVAIIEDKRRSERKVMEEFEKMRPAILGLILDATSMGLKRADEVHADKLPRMADHILWVAACEPALPWEAGKFLEAYNWSKENMITSLVEDDRLASAVYSFAFIEESFQGSPTTLWTKLNDQEGINSNHPPMGWPKSAGSLSAKLNRIAPALRARGVDVSRDRSSQSRWIRVEFKGEKKDSQGGNDSGGGTQSSLLNESKPTVPPSPMGMAGKKEINNIESRKIPSSSSSPSMGSVANEGGNGSSPAFTPEEDKIMLRGVGRVRHNRAILKAYTLADFIRHTKAIPPGRCREWLTSKGGIEGPQGEWTLPDDVLVQADLLNAEFLRSLTVRPVPKSAKGGN